jgi:hypothetical protein
MVQQTFSTRFASLQPSRTLHLDMEDFLQFAMKKSRRRRVKFASHYPRPHVHQCPNDHQASAQTLKDVFRRPRHR